jgi:hypothetical protein
MISMQQLRFNLAKFILRMGLLIEEPTGLKATICM